jgi:hypothetical protein
MRATTMPMEKLSTAFRLRRFDASPVNAFMGRA